MDNQLQPDSASRAFSVQSSGQQSKIFKYKELCEYLNLPVLGGDSKKAQLKQLQSQYDITILPNPTRYLFNGEYPIQLKALDIHSNDKFQKIFDAIMFRLLIENKGRALYLSNMELIKLFQEVNDNFVMTFDKAKLVYIDIEYLYMADMTDVVYHILKEWTWRKIESMAKRQIISIGEGFRLYSHGPNNMAMKFDVPLPTSVNASPLSTLCQTIYAKTYKQFFPKSDDGKINRALVLDKTRLGRFNRALNKAIEEATNGEYYKIKKVHIITGPDEEWLYDRLADIYKEYPDVNLITEEVCRKIMETKQLDDFTGRQRKLYIETNIRPNPRINLRQPSENKNSPTQ